MAVSAVRLLTSTALTTFGRRDDRSHVTLRVLGNVHEQAEHGRGQSPAPHAARLEIDPGRRLAHRVDRARDRGQRRRARSSALRPSSSISASSCVHLRVAEHLAAHVRQQAVDASAEVPQMKADRGRAAGQCPELPAVSPATALGMSSAACMSACAAGITIAGIPAIGPRSQGSAMAFAA